MSSLPDDSNLKAGGYYVGRIDSLDTRLSRIEGQIGSLATKEDVANAKLSVWAILIPVLTAIGAALIISVVNALIALNTG